MEDQNETNVETKVCTKCLKDLPLDDYYKLYPSKHVKKPRKPFGHYPHCKKCHNEMCRPHINRVNKKRYRDDEEYRKRIIEASRENVKKLRSTEEGRKKHNEQCLEHYYANREEVLEKMKERRQRKKDPQPEAPKNSGKPMTADELRQALRKRKLELAKGKKTK